eukprot:g5053.t1
MGMAKMLAKMAPAPENGKGGQRHIARGKRARLAAWRCKAEKTSGGLTAANLKKNKQGKSVAPRARWCTKKKHQRKGRRQSVEARDAHALAHHARA